MADDATTIGLKVTADADELKQLRQGFDDSKKSIAAMTASVEGLGTQLSKLSELAGIRDLISQFVALQKTTAAVAAEDRAAAIARRELTAAQRQASQEAKTLQDAQKRLQDALKRTDDDNRALRDSFGKLSGSATGAAGALRGVGASIATGIGVGTGIGIINAVASAIKGAATVGIEFNATIEQQQVAFETLLGSATKAEVRIRSLASFAAKTPFELPELVQANRQLQQLTNGALAGSEGMKLVGDAAAAVSRPIQEVSFWIGRLYAGLSTGTPVGEATLRLVELGLVSGDLKNRLDALAGQGIVGGEAWAVAERAFSRYAGAMEKQSLTLNGMLSTVRDTFKQLAGDLSKPLFDGFKTALREVLQLLGALPTPAQAVIDKIKDETDRLEALSAKTGSKGIAQTQSEIVASITKDQLRLDALRAGLASGGIGGKSLFAAGFTPVGIRQEIDSLETELARRRVLLGSFADQDKTFLEARRRGIEDELKKLSEAAKEVVVRDPLGNPSNLAGLGARSPSDTQAIGRQILSGSRAAPQGFSVSERGLTEAETKRKAALEAELAILSKTAAERAKDADATALSAKNAEAVAKAYAEATERAKKLKEDLRKAREEQALESKGLEGQKAVLIEQAKAVEQQRKERVALALTTDDAEKRQTLILDANNVANLKLLEIEDKRRVIAEKIATARENEAKKLKEIEDKARAAADRARIDELRVKNEQARRQVEGKAAGIRNDRFLTDKQKRAQLFGVFQGEANALPGQIAAADAVAKGVKGSSEKVAAQAEARRLRDRQEFGNPSDLRQNAPSSTTDDILAQITEIQNGFLTVGDAVGTTIQGAIDGVATSMQGLLQGTMSWGQALQNIGGSILNSVIGAISRMFAEWIVGRAAAGAASILWSTKEGAADVAAKTPGALLTSISSFGVAAVLGVAALVAALASFDVGGYTSASSTEKPVGVVHANEWVAPPWMTQDPKYGSIIAGLESARTGSSSINFGSGAPAYMGGVGGLANNSQSDSAPGASINQAFFNTQQDAEEWLRSQPGRRVMVDFLRKNQYDL